MGEPELSGSNKQQPRDCGILKKTATFFRSHGGTALLVAGIIGLTANGYRLESQNRQLMARHDKRVSECASTEYDLTSCERGKHESEKEVKDLKGNVLFKGGKAVLYFNLLDGQSYEMRADVRILNNNVSEGSLNRHIMRVCKIGCDIGELERFLGRERIRRFFHNGRFSPFFHVKLGNGAMGALPNYLAFADTHGVKQLADFIKERSRDDTEFVANVLYVKSQVNTYSYDFTGEARYPLETFLEGGGDCGASSIFVGSIIKAAHPDWKVQFIGINGLSPADPSTINHAIILVDSGKGKWGIETTADDYRRALEAYDGKEVKGFPFDL